MTNAPTAAETAAPAPVPAPAAVKAKPRVCPECSGEFEVPAKGPGGHKRFCQTSCRTTWANREKAQGAVLITVAKLWRETRGSGEIGKAAFAEMTSILDTLSSDDRAAGRKSLKSADLDHFARALIADRYIDRRR